ncbi:MAG: hypothetical protein RL135_1580, partial [Bacteroidota bacterium]
MNRISKINVKTRLAIVLFLYLGILTFLMPNLQAQTLPTNNSKSLKDTLSKPIPKDSMRIKTDTLKISKDSIDAPIKYNAEDSGVLVITTREFFLYGKAKVDYTDLKLDAATIKYDQRAQMVQAYGSKDSSGNPSSKPQFIQGEMKSISDTIFYNMKSGKGL